MMQQATLGEILASADGLRALRIAHGVDAHDMAAHLGVPLRQLDAIEEGRWEELPGAAFVRPLLFAYGRRIGVEDRRLLVRLLPGELQDIDSTLQSDSQQSRLLPRGLLGFAHGGAGRGLVWLSLALLASMVVIHFYARPF
jgi:cytoskeleton protein RodZ